MPTAAAYREAAGRYRVISENLMRESAVITRWSAGFVGSGRQRDRVESSFGRTARHLGCAAQGLLRLSHVCDARSEVCARYATQLRQYRQLTLARQLLVDPPMRPAWWVEV